MSLSIVLHLARHEWRSMLRRNFAGFVAGLFPIAVSPVVGLLSSSVAQTFDDLKHYGLDSSESYVILAGLAGVIFFPILYAVFLSSDALVLEKELGTLELIFWAPIRELDLLLGKVLLPYIFSLMVGVMNILLFCIGYVVGGLMLDRVITSPWGLAGALSLILVVSLVLAVMIGVLVSAYAPSTKAAATTSLAVGGVLAIAEGVLGLFLAMNGMSALVVLVTVGIVVLLSACGTVGILVGKVSNKELYFLKGQDGG